MGYPDRHFLADWCPLRENDARLERERGATSIAALEFNDQIGFGKCAINFAVREVEMIVYVAREPES